MEKMRIPGLLWIAIAALGVMTFIHLLLAFKTGSPAFFGAVVLEVILVVGLVHGRKWAYVLLFVFSVLGVAVSLSSGLQAGLGVLVGNAIVVIPMVICTRFFFATGRATPQSQEPERSQP